MTWTNPDTVHTPTTGAVIPTSWGAMVNQNLLHLHKLLTSPPMIIAYRAPQTTLGPGNPNIALTSILRDTMPQWGYAPGWTAEQNIYIWLRHPGVYLVFARVIFAVSTLDFSLRLWRDESQMIAIEQPRVWAAASGANPITTVVSNGTTRIHMQVQGATDGLVMEGAAMLGAVWLGE